MRYDIENILVMFKSFARISITYQYLYGPDSNRIELFQPSTLNLTNPCFILHDLHAHDPVENVGLVVIYATVTAGFRAMFIRN
jgi:hypothetical protein